jgi:hypothetical protein
MAGETIENKYPQRDCLKSNLTHLFSRLEQSASRTATLGIKSSHLFDTFGKRGFHSGRCGN